MKGNTQAEIINNIESCVRKVGIIEASKSVNVALAFIGHETPRYKLVSDAWRYVILSQGKEDTHTTKGNDDMNSTTNAVAASTETVHIVVNFVFPKGLRNHVDSEGSTIDTTGWIPYDVCKQRVVALACKWYPF